MKHGEMTKKAHDMIKQYVGSNTKEEGVENEKRIQRINDEYKPLTIKNNNVLVAPDWHGPFYDRKLESALHRVANEYKVRTLLIPGDFWDCDGYTTFLKLTYMETFQEEKRHIKKILDYLGTDFKMVYFCRGNHEKRWLKMNNGLSGIEDLFAILQSKTPYEVTLDDHMILESGGETWRISHPQNFSPCQLSVATRLADIHHMNILSAHGHQFAQGYDKSGRFQVVDGGGMFDVKQIEYLRNTTCYPSVHSGFYLIQDGDAYPFPGKNIHGVYR